MPTEYLLFCYCFIVFIIHHSQTSKEPRPVELLWGVSDKTAKVGKIFQVVVPRDAFKGNVLKYEFRSVESSSIALPSWLQYNSSSNILEGVPEAKDLRQYYIHVTAHGLKSHAHDVFTIDVQPRKINDNDDDNNEVEECIDFVTTARILLPSLFAEKRCCTIRNLARHFNLSNNEVTLSNNYDPENDESKIGETLISGLGNVYQSDDTNTNNNNKSILSWVVGCGNVKARHVKYLENLVNDAKNGILASVLETNVLGWSVNNGKIIKTNNRRRRRNRRDVWKSKTFNNNEEYIAEGSGPEQTSLPLLTTSQPIIITTIRRCRHHHCDTSAVQSSTMQTEELITPTTVSSSIEEPKYSSVFTPRPDRTKPRPLETTTSINNRVKLNHPPIISSVSLDHFEVEPGSLFNFTIKEDLFYDEEQGNTRNLELKLMTTDRLEVHPQNWLQLNKTSQILWGVPMKSDQGDGSYLLAAIDNENRLAIDQFSVTVKKQPPIKIRSHEFSIKIDYDYVTFNYRGSLGRLDIIGKLASYMREVRLENIVITQLRKGSVLFSWRNSTIDRLSQNELYDCPKKLIEDNVNTIADLDVKSKNYTIKNEFLKAMKPYVIKSFGVKPLGVCSIGNFHEQNIHVSNDNTDKNGANDNKSAQQPQDIMLTTIVPAILIVVMLLVAAIVACVLYRARRKNKMTVLDKQTFVSKGIPVIFADELDDTVNGGGGGGNQSVTKPLIMTNEKAPQVDDKYTRQAFASGSSSTFGHRQAPKQIQQQQQQQQQQAIRQPPPYIAP